MSAKWLSPFKSRRETTVDTDYIPYNGPYEQPKPKPALRQRQDSWGDDEIDPELTSRYWVPRQRTQSGVSSSGTVDPTRRSVFANGGVGEAPVPVLRSPVTKRVSLANLFTRKSVTPLDDYYNSYYASLADPNSHSYGLSSVPTSPASYHPYANPFSVPQTPSSAPPTSTPPPPSAFPRRLKEKPSKSSLTTPRELKNSTSTPNLRAPTLRLPKPKIKDRWLSAETWCDAILFPRPRFKLQDQQRIISPPSSPVYPAFQSNAAPAVTSRVLAYSRSLVDLQQPTLYERERALQVIPPTPPGAPPARPRSFAFDDLALPSPIPSLSKVLEDGQILDHQRKKWQVQAEKSFQNSRTRNLSRSRTKSLTKPKRPTNEKLPAIDFLAARSLLGNQNVIPVAEAKPARLRKNSQSRPDAKTTFSRGTHSHNTSLSKSSKSHSRAHSRSDSLGKSALKVAKAICGVDDKPSPPADETLAGLEGALQNDRTKVIRLADPAQIQVDADDYTPISSSPTPSHVSDTRVGIALSTPPPLAGDSVRLFSHPYAQGGLYTVNGQRDYAGPHPTTNPQLLSPEAARTDVQRHRLPPQAVMHPYAQAGWRDSYQSYQGVVPQLRPDSDVPAPSKMWAQFSPGVLREVLPHEIIYSPFMSENGSAAQTPVTTHIPGADAPIFDTVGVGEALFNAMQKRRSRDGDSGLGTSEGPVSLNAEDYAQDQVDKSEPYRMARKPVQHDPVVRPLYPHKMTSQTLETIQSSGTLSTDQSPDHSQQSSSPDSNVLLSDDIEHFRDLFYRPSGATIASSSISAVPSTPAPFNVRNNSFPWDGRRTGSGLTSIARQLTEELEEVNEELEKGDHNLHFFLSESTSLVDVPAHGVEPGIQDIPAFKPSLHIPEDVQSSRASSVMAGSPLEDTEKLFRLGLVESNTTPPPTESEFRKSYTAFHDAGEREERTAVMRAHGSLAPSSLPSDDPARSSYLTASSVSGMSGLSDFPAPPVREDLTPAHMSLLSSYFEQPSKNEPIVPPSNSHQPDDIKLDRRRFTFGRGDDVEELLASLSDHS